MPKPIELLLRLERYSSRSPIRDSSIAGATGIENQVRRIALSDDRFARDLFPDHVIDRIVAVQDAVHVKSITYSAAREQLAETMDRVCEDHAPVVITRKRDQAVVMMSLAE